MNRVCPLCHSKWTSLKKIHWNWKLGSVITKYGHVFLLPREADIFEVIYKRGPISRVDIAEAVYGWRIDKIRQPENCVSVFISTIRKKIAPLRVAIKLIGWKWGYYVEYYGEEDV